MKFNKKYLSILLVLSLSVFIMVGCGGSSDDEGEINNVLDDFAEGFQEANIEQLENVFAETIISGNEEFSSEEFAELIAGLVQWNKEEVVVEFRNRDIGNINDSVKVEAEQYTKIGGEEEVEQVKLGLVNQDGNWYINSFE